MYRYEKMLWAGQRKEYRCGIFVERNLDPDKQACIHTCIHTYIHAYIFVERNLDPEKQAYIPTYLHTYIHAYMHACIHTYIFVERNLHPDKQADFFLQKFSGKTKRKNRFFCKSAL